MLRLLAFAVPSALAAAGVQPLLGYAVGAVSLRSALGLAGPAVIGAGLGFGVGRVRAHLVFVLDPVARRVCPGGCCGNVHLWRARRAVVDHVDDVGPSGRRIASVGSGDGAGAQRLALSDDAPPVGPTLLFRSPPHRQRLARGYGFKKTVTTLTVKTVLAKPGSGSCPHPPRASASSKSTPTSGKATT